MKRINQEDWDLIHDRTNKIRAINALRRNSGYDLPRAKNIVEKVWAGSLSLEETFEKGDPCKHCDGTGFAK